MLPAAHQERFSKFAKDLESAVKSAIPAGFGRYERAAIMAFDWNNDTMGVKALRDDLLRLFKTGLRVQDGNLRDERKRSVGCRKQGFQKSSV
jgi:hypothetical protein